ncbi:MOSC domain-containing protein YiiM [Rhizobium sp. RU20A]|uniref:MOSC domain-containing protein n=1 Tax=Rhizobium sp. RU20A TaxID=1907412 RepID=UPI0009552734|nr:MOSC domain-containing protein [Rhizobium sp. RU20A]SIQ75602.1 MOSC domain-containing protein YiiM [Rhizobium sp. RU20A]
MKILAVCIGQARKLPGKSYKTGIAKAPVTGPVMLDSEGLVGDAIINRKHHGGPEQAVYIEGGETLAWWAQELGRALEPGTFGENLVISGLDNRDVAIGDRFTIGDVILEATSARSPCATFAAHMDDPMMVKRYLKAERPGIYTRVISGGMLEAGQNVTYAPFAGERIGMAEFMDDYGRIPQEKFARYLATPVNAKIRAKIS